MRGWRESLSCLKEKKKRNRWRESRGVIGVRKRRMEVDAKYFTFIARALIGWTRNQEPMYLFNYKSDPEEKSIGG